MKNTLFNMMALWILKKSWDVSAKLKTIDKNFHVLPRLEFTNSLKLPERVPNKPCYNMTVNLKFPLILNCGGCFLHYHHSAV